MKAAAVATSFACGAMLGVGVAVGGMADSRKSNSFFNVFNVGTELWDPSLGIVFAAAVIVNAVLYHSLLPRMKRPLFAEAFCIPTRCDLPWQLFAGSALFGVGWSLGGFCPGPAIVSSVTGDRNTLLFSVAMVIGMWMYKSRQEPAAMSRPALTLRELAASPMIAVLLAAVAAAYAYTAAVPRHTGEGVLHAAFYQPYSKPALGGALIGGSVFAMMALTGQVLGISGIVSGLFAKTRSMVEFRLAFVAGLVAAGLVMLEVDPIAITNHMHRPWPFFVLGGALVGFGTGMGCGCTSGHGVAGLTRLSQRSIIAVASFFISNAVFTSLLYSFGIGMGWQEAMRG